MPDTEVEGQRFRSSVKNIIIFYFTWIVLSVLLLITGIILLNSPRTEILRSEYVYDYTNCLRHNFDSDESNITCSDYIKSNKGASCRCYHLPYLDLRGEVTFYYELPDFDQTATNYINSKDDDQLKGIITETPSSNCVPYQYDNGKPIVPCGAIANSMFSDELRYIKLYDNGTLVDLLRYGMLSAKDKAGFQNPKDLVSAVQHFSKPKDWTKAIYDLDKENEDNNGFQNEYFISWMRTDWKRKPIARVGKSVPEFAEGLPPATYQLLIYYVHSPLLYNGSRKLIIAAEQKIEVPGSPINSVMVGFGIVMLVAGVLAPVVVKKYSDKTTEAAKTRQNVDDTTLPPLLNEENRPSAPALTQSS